jgi:hypothetical protein
MSTVTVAHAGRPQTIGAYDRVFYTGMAFLMALTVFVGFAPTYYLRSYFGGPVTVSGSVSLSPLTHLHGALFTGWTLLFIVQTGLVATRRVATHRRLGIAGAVLALLMIVVGVSTAIGAAGRGAAPPGVDPLAFLIVPLGDMVLFAGFVGAAMWWRRNREAHKRLMLLAYTSIIVAAVARFPGVLAYGPLAFFGLALGFPAIGMVYDRASRRRVHPAYIWGALLLAASVPLRLVISETGAWRSFAEWLTR